MDTYSFKGLLGVIETQQPENLTLVRVDSTRNLVRYEWRDPKGVKPTYCGPTFQATLQEWERAT